MLLGNHHMEHDGFSDKSEREAHDEWDAAANENGGRLTEESDVEQSDEPSPGPQATAYVEQSTEEMAEVRPGSVVWVGFHIGLEGNHCMIISSCVSIISRIVQNLNIVIKTGHGNN